jgi:RNase P subunit RPR2
MPPRDDYVRDHDGGYHVLPTAAGYPPEIRGHVPRDIERTWCRRCAEHPTKVAYVKDGKAYPTCPGCAWRALTPAQQAAELDRERKDAF